MHMGLRSSALITMQSDTSKFRKSYLGIAHYVLVGGGAGGGRGGDPSMTTCA